MAETERDLLNTSCHHMRGTLVQTLEAELTPENSICRRMGLLYSTLIYFNLICYAIPAGNHARRPDNGPASQQHEQRRWASSQISAFALICQLPLTAYGHLGHKLQHSAHGCARRPIGDYGFGPWCKLAGALKSSDSPCLCLSLMEFITSIKFNACLWLGCSCASCRAPPLSSSALLVP